MNAQIKLLLCIGLSSLIHLFIFTSSHFIAKKSGGRAGGGGVSNSKPLKLEGGNNNAIKPRMAKRKTTAAEKKKDIAARVTSNDEKLKKNNGIPNKKEAPQQNSAEAESKLKTNKAVNLKADTEKAKFVHAEVRKVELKRKKTLQEEIEDLSKKKKSVIKSKMTRQDYIRYKKSMNYGRMKGIPTPNLAFAFYDLSEILTVHRAFGIKIIVLNPHKPYPVVEIAGLDTGSPYCQKIEHFNFKAFSNRIYRRKEPFFQKYLKEAQKVLNDDSAIIISIVPAASDSYFRYKIIEVIKRNGYKPNDVKTVIARFHKTSFSSMILVIEELYMKDSSIKKVTDFELQKLQSN